MGTHIFPGRGPCHQVPLPEAPYKVDGFLAATQFDGAVKLIQDYWAVVLAYLFDVYFTGTRLLQVRLLALLGVCKRPWPLREVEGRWQWPSLDCHSFYGTACAFGLTWRPLTGSLCLSSFWCRLKPGPSGERGRKSGLLQDMLVTGLGPTSERVDGRVQAWTRLALDSFKGSNPVWRATGHNEPVDGRVQTWTRHGSVQHSASEHRQNVHRNICETIGHFQPTRMGDRF